jgi:hypothetical protein
MLDRVRVCERIGQCVAVTLAPGSVFGAGPALDDESLDIERGVMGAVGAQDRSLLDVHLS